jgi:L-fuconolactonase
MSPSGTRTLDRMVDAHVHLWDPARRDWYPHLSRNPAGSNMSRQRRLYDQAAYFADAGNWNVVKYVHVAAAVSPFMAAETVEREEWHRSTGHPDAIVGGLDPAQSLADNLRSLEEQCESSRRFRGVRLMGFIDGGVPSAEILRVLNERGLVLDVMAQADALNVVAATISEWGELTVVIEHAGWPRENSDDEYRLWQQGMDALAAAGLHVHCKLSGLAMPFHAIDTTTFRPWIEYALEAFGVDRCMFGSNFPVDSMYGSFDDLYSTYDELTANLDANTREKLFASNAERVYSC